MANQDAFAACYIGSETSDRRSRAHVKVGKISTAWVSASTQNSHCRETKFSPVTGIRGVPGMLVAVGASSVTVGRTSCPVGGTVHTGVGDARVNLPQADVKNIKVNAPIKT